MRTFGLKPHHCPVCGVGTTWDAYIELMRSGWTQPTDHDCEAEAERVFNRFAAGLTPLHMEFDAQTAHTTTVTEAVADYVADFDRYVKEAKGLVFLRDNYGSGKTTALSQIVSHGLNLGYIGNAALVRFQDIIGAYKREDAESFEEWLSSIKILAIDEVIAPKSDAQATLFERFADVVDARYVAKRPIFLAGNIRPDELAEHYPKVFSRLHTMADFIEVPDIDFRTRARQAPDTDA